MRFRAFRIAVSLFLLAHSVAGTQGSLCASPICRPQYVVFPSLGWIVTPEDESAGRARADGCEPENATGSPR